MKNLKTAAKFVAKSTKSEKAAETKAEDRIAERIAEKVAKWEVLVGHAVQGIEFLVNKAVEVGKDVRHFQQAVIEKNPELAKHYLDIGLEVVKIQSAAEERAGLALKDVVAACVNGSFDLAGKLVEKIDWSPLVQAAAARLSSMSELEKAREDRAKAESQNQMECERMRAEAKVRAEQAEATYRHEQTKYETLRQQEKALDIEEKKEEIAARKSERSRKPAQA